MSATAIAERISAPPWVPALAAWLAVVGSAILLRQFAGAQHTRWHLAGWVLGSVVTVACLACHRLLDQRRRRRSDYVWSRSAGTALYLAVACGSAIGLVHAYWVAQWYLGNGQSI